MPELPADDLPGDGTPGDAAPGDAGREDGLSYENARAQLREIVTRLESGSQTLEESLALWERGERLARICQTWLAGARSRLDEVLDDGASPAGGDTP